MINSVPFEPSHTAVESRLLRKALHPGARVLDAGCGRRTRLSAYRERIVELVGIDIDAVAGQENAALDRFVEGDLCERLPFEDSRFDLVYANFVVEHLARPAAAFSEWRRLLSRNGSLILLTSNQANPLMLAARLLPASARVAIKAVGAGAAEHDVVPVRYGANTPGRLASLLRDAGFAPVTVTYVATLYRYAERKPLLASSIQRLERGLPARLRSTIVGWYQARSDG